jgi:formimidoylglutamate deiminase
LRIALLRVAYARSGYETELNPRQSRFLEKNPDLYLQNLEKLTADLAASSGNCWVGVAPHSVRAVPLDYLREVVRFGNDRNLKIHMHVAEQPAEVSACIKEYGRSPIALLDSEGLLSERFTAVHAIHVTSKAAHMVANAHAMVCACPTTERNLGDGVFPADIFLRERVPVSLGTDSQIEIDLLEDAREIEYHLRLQKMERAVLADPEHQSPSALAAHLFDCATVNGAASIGAPGGSLEAGRAADFFTVDLNDPSIAGAFGDDLLPTIVFSLSRTAVKDVIVGGKRIVENGRHADQEEIVWRFAGLQKKLWGENK